MFTTNRQCPVCHTAVTDWSARCPRCRYHLDCDDRDCYNRAQDDVALLVRCHARPVRAAARGHGDEAQTWRRFLPEWLRRPLTPSVN